MRVGGEEEMDRALEGAAEVAGIRWDREKWKGKEGKHLGLIMGTHDDIRSTGRSRGGQRGR